MTVSGRQETTEAHMQNESCPRRARRRKVHRRGSQQAGRIGRAKRKRGRSFCGLVKDCFGRTVNRIGPFKIFWPMIREPAGRRFQSADPNVSAIPDCSQPFSIVENLRRKRCLSEVRGLAVSVSNNEKGGDSEHTQRYAVHIPSCQRFIYRLPNSHQR